MDNNKDVMATAELLKNKLVIWDAEEQKKIFEEKYFGKFIEEEKTVYLQLSLEDGMLLIERGHIDIVHNKRKIDVKKFYNICCTMDPEFPQKFTVYRNLRNRGFIVKSGFKFGTHFRVYDRGVNPYKSGSKELKEHTKYNVHAVPENYAHSYQEWSRYVRLSQNIRAKALLAVVDEEGDVTYYVITRIRP
ncbi:MAG: tRNA-intron lyase [archaeon]|nr:tRNA-intron lyase [archaeon]